MPKSVKPADDDWGDFSEVAAKSAGVGKSQCSIAKFLDLLASPSAVQELGQDVTPHVRKALANEALTHRGIIRALRSKLDMSWQIPGEQSIARHRKGECHCPREAA